MYKLQDNIAKTVVFRQI